MSSSAHKAVLALILSLLVSSCHSHDPAQANSRERSVTASGRIDSASEARFLVAERDGVIDSVLVKPGDKVAQGALLLSLSCGAERALAAAAAADSRAMAATRLLIDEGARREERDAAQARLEEAEAQARDAEASLARAEQLEPRGFVSRSQLDSLRARATSTSAAASVARSNLESLANGPRLAERRTGAARQDEAAARAAAASAEVERCRLRAPISGTVARVLRREGEASGASTGTPLVVLADLSRLIVRAEIADRDVPFVTLGSRAIVSVDGHSDRWHARVSQLAQQMGRRSARSLDPTDRFDRDIREALLTFDGAAPPPVVGLRVNVEFRR